MGVKTGQVLSKAGALLARIQKPTAEEIRQRRIATFRGNYPEGTGLIERAAEELHSRQIPEENNVVIEPEERTFEGRIDIRFLASSNMKNIHEMENIFDVCIGINGKITVATNCVAANCQFIDSCKSKRN